MRKQLSHWFHNDALTYIIGMACTGWYPPRKIPQCLILNSEGPSCPQKPDGWEICDWGYNCEGIIPVCLKENLPTQTTAAYFYNSICIWICWKKAHIYCKTFSQSCCLKTVVAFEDTCCQQVVTESLTDHGTSPYLRNMDSLWLI